MKENLGKQLEELWDDNAEIMGEMAAYHVSCEMLGIDPDDGWKLMKKHNENEINKVKAQLKKDSH